MSTVSAPAARVPQSAPYSDNTIQHKSQDRGRRGPANLVTAREGRGTAVEHVPEVQLELETVSTAVYICKATGPPNY